MIGTNVATLFNPSLQGGLGNPPNINNLQTGLQAYYKFDENTGTTIKDFSGNSNNLAFGGSPSGQWGTGKINSGVVFDGLLTWYLEKTSGITGIPNTQANQSFSCWFKVTDNNKQYCILDVNNGFQGNEINVLSTGYIRVTRWGGTELITSGAPVSTGVFHHILWTWNGTNEVLYIDGAVSNTNTNTPQTGTPSKIVVGSYQDVDQFTDKANSFKGIIDEIGIWNRALISSEVTLLYNANAALQYPF